jgi:hypothetical protein
LTGFTIAVNFTHIKLKQPFIMNIRKQKRPAKGKLPHRYMGKFFGVLMLMLCGAAIVSAQTKLATPVKTTTLAKVELKPAAYNLVDYQKTPQAAVRKAKYKSALAQPYTKEVKFYDGSKVTMTYSKTTPKNEEAVVTKNKSKPVKSTANGLICTTTMVTLDANSSDFLSNNVAGADANMYPGAVYTLKNLTNGSYQQQEGARNPMVITTNNPNAALSSVTVNDPNMGTINTAIAKIYKGFGKGSGQQAFAYSVSQAATSATYNLSIGAAASGYGVDLSNVYSNSSESNHVHLTIDAMKTMFSICSMPPDAGIFTDPTIENDPTMTYIAEVSYGVQVMANADITFSSEAEADAFKAAYSGFGFTASLDLSLGSTSKATSTTINGYIVGGPGNQVIAYTLSQLKDLINKTFANATYAEARPLSYEAMTMDGSVVQNQTLTSSFPEQSCVPADGGASQFQDVEITFNQGPDGKEASTPFYVSIMPGLSPKPNDVPMFGYQMLPNVQRFENNASDQVVLTKGQGYKGAIDITAFAKAGGGRVVLTMQSGPYDEWQLTGLTVDVTVKASSGSGSGSGPPPEMKWAFSGADLKKLDNKTNNQLTLLFDGTMTPMGPDAVLQNK